jgi:hypothetical protein
VRLFQTDSAALPEGITAVADKYGVHFFISAYHVKTSERGQIIRILVISPSSNTFEIPANA